MAAPAETRTPNMHRAKPIAPRECGWKHGDSGYSAGETLVSQKPKPIDLTTTGLLMEAISLLCAFSSPHKRVFNKFARRPPSPFSKLTIVDNQITAVTNQDSPARNPIN